MSRTFAQSTTGSRAFTPARPAGTPRRLALHPSSATGGGFGKTSRKKVDTKVDGSYVRPGVNPRLQEELGVSPPKPVSNEPKPGWKFLGEQSKLFQTKDIKAIDLGPTTLALFKYKGKVYCSNAYSTAFKYPLIDAKVMDGPQGQPVVETPLDGTQYELETGKVLVWCPSNGPVRSLLGAIKKDAPQADLQVYPVEVLQGKVYAKLTKG